MDIKGIGQDLSSVYGNFQKDTSIEQEFQKILNQTMEASNQEKKDEELKEACESFESYYVQRLFKEMRKTVPDGGLFEKSNAGEIYSEMLGEEYSKIISEGHGIGIADALYKQLSSTNK